MNSGMGVSEKLSTAALLLRSSWCRPASPPRNSTAPIRLMAMKENATGMPMNSRIVEPPSRSREAICQDIFSDLVFRLRRLILSMVSSPAKAGDPVTRSTSIEMRVSGLLDAPLSTEVGLGQLRQLLSERNRKHPISRGITIHGVASTIEEWTNIRSCRHLDARGPILPQAVAQDLAAVALGNIRNDENLLRHFWRRQKGLAMLAHGGFCEAAARLGDHVAYHFLPIDFIRHPHRGSLENSRMFQQDLVDLDRRDVDAAPDDQILDAAGDANESVRVLDGKVAGLDAVGANGFDRSVVPQIADRRMRPARRHFTFDARRAWFAVGVDDGEFLVQRRDADRADAILVGAIAAHPAGFRHAVHL